MAALGTLVIESMAFTQRTAGCGEPRLADSGKTLTLNGWAHRIRDLGGLTFVDVRDRTGLRQLVFDPSIHPGAQDIKPESCLSVTGNVTPRDASARNPKLGTGDVELVVSSFEILSPAGVLPFQLSDEGQMQRVNEELRVKHRYLDLRRPTMHQRLAIRAKIMKGLRSYLDSQGFMEVETPVFTKSTPEGARDYLVPYRLKPGLFYALPQSPQQYKQLLMVAGIDRYYQIARCFRDEAQRADRQPEFTQLDLEMSFVVQEDVLNLAEGLMLSVVGSVIEEFALGMSLDGPFERMTYDEAMEWYGTDKPDTRFGLRIMDLSEEAGATGFAVFKNTVEAGGTVKAILYPGGSTLSRKQISELEEVCKGGGAKGMAALAVLAEGQEAEGAVSLPSGARVRCSFAKFLTPEQLDSLAAKASAKPGDLICFAADQSRVASESLGKVRLAIGDACGLRDPKALSFCWVLDFPLLEWSEEEQRWDAMHHPFTSPKVRDMALLETDPGAVRADCYDLVCNGIEVGSGSIRIHQPEVQARMFSLLGFSPESQKERFGHMLEAFSYGPPPHGGIAPGVDRLVMLLTGDENIREVIAFPKMGNGLDPLMGAPDVIDDKQWEETGLMVKPSATEPKS
jgi:aspartyl-tRNA synthetase